MKKSKNKDMSLADLEKKFKKPLSFTNFEICTNLFDKNGNKLIDLDLVNKALSKHGMIDMHAQIIHDSDIFKEEDIVHENEEYTNRYNFYTQISEDEKKSYYEKAIKNGDEIFKDFIDLNLKNKDDFFNYLKEKDKIHELNQEKASHIHLLVKFNGKSSANIDTISEWFGVEKQYVNKISTNWKNALAYLCHRTPNSSHKYQYDYDKVICSENLNYQKEMEVYERIQASKISEDELDKILLDIADGKIRRFNQSEIPDLLAIKKSAQIEKAFKRREQKRKEMLNKEMINMNCIFMTGDSGCGKTTYAKEYCDKHNLSFYISSGSNDVLDGYEGQDCLILDDLRPSCMGMSDLLKMLDNNTRSSVKSRYFNKILECSLIIITTTLPIDTFFFKVFQDHPETIVQLKRRCGIMMEFSRQIIDTYIYDNDVEDYILYESYKNEIDSKFSYAKKEAELKNILAGFGFEKIKDNEFFSVKEKDNCPFLN